MRKSVLSFLILSLCLIQAISAQQTPPASASAATTMNLAPTSGYLLGPGDIVGAKVMGEAQFDFTSVVDENGNIEVPFLDKPISAMCKSGTQLKTDVAKGVAKYVRNPQVGLTIDRKSRPPVTVTGEVRTPGQVTIMRETRLLELISFSGGETENAGGNVEVFRQRPPMCGSSEEIASWRAEAANSTGVPSRVYSLSLVKSGSTESDPMVNPGDIVVVQKASPVYIVGEVRNPTGLYIKDGGLRLTQAVAMVGGVTREAKTKDVKIYRRKPDSIDQEIISVNLDAIKKGEQKDIMLEANDQIEVDKAKEGIGKTIMKLVVGAGTTGITTIATGGASRILY